MHHDAQPVKLYHIPVELPIRRIYSRLGYRKATTQVSEHEQQTIQHILDEGMLYCQLSGVYLRRRIERKEEGTIVLDTGTTWNSRQVVRFLSASPEVFLIAATAGAEIVEQRDRLLQQGKTFKAVILDALGSEMVESAIQWIHDYVGKLVRKNGRILTKRRYSPGYGDFSLENQQSLFSLLKLAELDLRLTDHFILLPEKSVTAIVGVE